MGRFENYVIGHGFFVDVDTRESEHSILYNSDLYSRRINYRTVSKKIWGLSGRNGNRNGQDEKRKAL